VEVQASQIKAERDKADMLAKQLQACREEAAWLRNRCVSCNKVNMPGTVQLPEQLLCHPVKQLKGRLCSSADSFMQTYVHHLLLHEVNMPPLQLHICMADETSAANGVPQGIALRSDSVLRCSLICNHHSVLIDVVEQFNYSY